MSEEDKDTFKDLISNILDVDPKYWIEKNINLDGKPMRLSGNGYKPFVDMYRYIGIKSLEPTGKPVVIVSGRQVGKTTLACSLSLFFTASELFGKANRPPMRVMHVFPALTHAEEYAKSKLNPTITGSRVPKEEARSKNPKSILQLALDTTSNTNDSLRYKRFKGGNILWVESTGLDADRLRGRQLALDTELPTPNGFVKLIDLKQGDQLFDEKGNVCNITKMHPINLSPESYKIAFDDGTCVEACAEHLWLTSTKEISTIKTTREIFETLDHNHSIQTCYPVKYNKSNIEGDPYVFGLTARSIPQEYMISSVEQRLALLQGIIHTCGSLDGDKYKVSQSKLNKEFFYQILELIKSLGIKTSTVKIDDNYSVEFYTSLQMFRFVKATNSTSCNHRYIVNVERIESKPMRCITVDSPSRLYLITRSFIATHNTADAIFFDEVQDIRGEAILNSLKILTKAQHGQKGAGVQIFFGTPKRQGSEYHKMWQSSNQQYYYLGCERCGRHFPLYTPGSDEWENIWIKEFIVRCTFCNHEQNKVEAQERGKWIAVNNDPNAKMIGFHMNQLYNPDIPKEMVISQKPGIHPLSTERAYKNEVLGEFFQGDSSPITDDQIIEFCGLPGVKMTSSIPPGEKEIVVLGLDYGERSDMDQLANPEKFKLKGQSYSTAVVLSASGAGLLTIEYATKFKKNDYEYKKSIIEQLIRQYSVNLAVGDIGYSNDLSRTLHTEYGDKYLVSRAQGKSIAKAKLIKEIYPKEIHFDRDFYIGDAIIQMKKGNIKFPLGDYEKISWLIQHCSSMELKPSISRIGEPTVHYVKGSTPNDGFMALINAYIAFQFIITNGFTIQDPKLMMNLSKKSKTSVPMILGYCPRN